MNGMEVDGMVLQVKLADRDKHGGGQQPSADLYISNLPLDYGAQEITDIFGKHGPISSLVVLTDDDGNSRGLAVVHYFKQESAAAAIAEWHGHVLPGHTKPLEVMYAKAKHTRAIGASKATRRNAPSKSAAGTCSPLNESQTTSAESSPSLQPKANPRHIWVSSRDHQPDTVPVPPACPGAFLMASWGSAQGNHTAQGCGEHSEVWGHGKGVW
jgi:RNA recognition motif-containing protein